MNLSQLSFFPIFLGQISIFLVSVFLEFRLNSAAEVLTQEQIKEELVKDAIIPDVILNPPPYALEVCYQRFMIFKKRVHFGTIMPPAKLQAPPISIKWPYEEDAYYTLILTSPDAPSRESPSLREWQHWLVGNIRQNAVSSGETLTEYRAPGFVCNTGLHRMVFLVFQQPKKIIFTEKKRRKRVLRSYFSTQVFASKYNLSNPIAANYLQIDCGSKETTIKPS